MYGPVRQQQSVYFVPVSASHLTSQTAVKPMQADLKKDAINKMYETFKQLLRCKIIHRIRELLPELKDHNVLLTLSLGRNSNQSAKPNLDIDKGNTTEWSLEDTLYQYFKGVPGNNNALTNLPPYVLVETLRYLHSNPGTKASAPTALTENTPFRPVLPIRVCHNGAYVDIWKIMPNDKIFLDSLNEQIHKILPDFELAYETIKGDGSSVVLNGKTLNLVHTYMSLVLQRTEKKKKPIYTPAIESDEGGDKS